jgi:hypothetical protein
MALGLLIIAGWLGFFVWGEITSRRAWRNIDDHRNWMDSYHKENRK